MNDDNNNNNVNNKKKQKKENNKYVTVKKMSYCFSNNGGLMERQAHINIVENKKRNDRKERI